MVQRTFRSFVRSNYAVRFNQIPEIASVYGSFIGFKSNSMPLDRQMNVSKSLECKGVGKGFGERTLFSDVCFELEKGERLALLGASGSGKSTLLHCLSGVLRPDSGEVKIGGQSLAGLDAEALAECRAQRTGTVFQFFHLLPTLTVSENVELPLQLCGQSREQRGKRVSELLERMGVAGRSEAFPSQLSGGEMQRVAIARAVAHRPAVLFADEPTGNLDSDSGARVLQLLRELTEEEGAAMLMVTHSEAAAAICHRRLELVEGAVSQA